MQTLAEILEGAERDVLACEARGLEDVSTKPDAWDVRYRLHWIIARGELAGANGATEATLREGYARVGHMLERLNRVLTEIDRSRNGPILDRATRQREAFLRKEYTPDVLLADLKAMSDRERFIFVEAFLNIRERPAPVAPGMGEMSGYTPADPGAVLEVVARVPRGSVLYDCGSGLGLVSMLYAQLTGSRSVGVERDPVLCENARKKAEALGLENVEFLLADARQVQYEAGDAFFFYNPFQGAVMREVLSRIEVVARKKEIRVFGLAANLEGAAWLSLVHRQGLLTVHRSTLHAPLAAH